MASQVRIHSAASGSSARVGAMSHGFGPLVRMPAEAARRLSGALLFGPNRILVDKVMISAVAAGFGTMRQHPKEKQRQLTFVSLIAFLTAFSRANRPDGPVLTSMNTISHDEIGETEN